MDNWRTEQQTLRPSLAENYCRFDVAGMSWASIQLTKIGATWGATSVIEIKTSLTGNPRHIHGIQAGYSLTSADLVGESAMKAGIDVAGLRFIHVVVTTNDASDNDLLVTCHSERF